MPTYYSPVMAASPPLSARRRVRPGSLERPVNSRLYRGTWLLVGLPLLVLAFSIAKPGPLPPPAPVLPPSFDTTAGTGPGAVDSASGVAALVEIARSYGNPTGGRAVTPTHTLIFLATDGGAFGGLGADHFARTYRGEIVAVVNLDALADRGAPRLV